MKNATTDQFFTVVITKESTHNYEKLRVSYYLLLLRLHVQ